MKEVYFLWLFGEREGISEDGDRLFVASGGVGGRLGPEVVAACLDKERERWSAV